MNIHGILLSIAIFSMVTVTAAEEADIKFDDDQGIVSIKVTGHARGRADTVYVKLVASAIAAEYGDALTQFREKTKGVEKAIEKLNIKNTSVIREMYQVGLPNNPAGLVMAGGVSGNMPSGIQVSQPITIKMLINPKDDFDSIASKITRILDAAGKSGFGFGLAAAMGIRIPGSTNPSISYVLEDTGPLVEEAIADALASADRIKNSLQERGIMIGKLVNVSYDGKDIPDMGRFNPAIMIGRQLGGPFTSSTPDEVTVTGSLTVSYQLHR